MQKIDFVKITEKKVIRVPDSVLEKLEAKANDSLVFYLNGGNIIIKKGEIT